MASREVKVTGRSYIIFGAKNWAGRFRWCSTYNAKPLAGLDQSTSTHFLPLKMICLSGGYSVTLQGQAKPEQFAEKKKKN